MLYYLHHHTIQVYIEVKCYAICITISLINRKLRNMKLSLSFVYVENRNMKKKKLYWSQNTFTYLPILHLEHVSFP